MYHRPPRTPLASQLMSHRPLFLASRLLSGLGDLTAGFLTLDDGLDDTDSNGLEIPVSRENGRKRWVDQYLSHVAHGETSQRCVVGESLNTHWLGGNHLDNGGVTRLDELGSGFDGFTGTTIDLLQELGELAGNVGSVAIEHWCVTGTDLAGVVEDDDLGVEGVGTLGRVLLGVASNHATADFLDGDVLDVKANVITWETPFLKLLVMHLDRLDFSGHVSRSEGHDL